MTDTSPKNIPSDWRADRSIGVDVAVLRNLEERLWWETRWAKNPNASPGGVGLAEAAVDTAKAVIGAMAEATPEARARTICARLLRQASARRREVATAAGTTSEDDAFDAAVSTHNAAQASVRVLAERGTAQAGR